ncbi:MAG TPA: ABC transporter ATP-binding protein [Bacteroidales bacterium]|nr:ABC transporter ATP-binding protein [Bacteroidales bacterium]
MSNEHQHIIVAKDLVKKFGSFVANNHLNFEVKSGEIFGLLGANGAGKTTAIKMMIGLLKPTSGELKVNGYDIYTETEKIRKTIGYMSQKFSLYEELTIYENIRFFGGIYGLSLKDIKSRAAWAENLFNLKGLMNKRVSEIPLGWKQKIAFVVANIHNPTIVFLDEPTGGVDPKVRRDFWDSIYQASANGTTIIVTTHYMDEAEYCQRVCIMNEGEIKALGSPQELKTGFNVDSINDLFVKIVRRK